MDSAELRFEIECVLTCSMPWDFPQISWAFMIECNACMQASYDYAWCMMHVMYAWYDHDNVMKWCNDW